MWVLDSIRSVFQLSMQNFWLNYLWLIHPYLKYKPLSSHAIIYLQAAISKELASLHVSFLSSSVTEPIRIKTKVRFLPKLLWVPERAYTMLKNHGINQAAAGLCVSRLVGGLSERRIIREKESVSGWSLSVLWLAQRSNRTSPSGWGCSCPDLVRKTIRSHKLVKA